jgi:hypothetical protein
MIFRVALLISLFQVCANAQQNPSDFVLDSSNPYVYLKLDHVGPRKPALKGEPSVGVWIRIVNNCRIPILVQTIGTDSGGDGITVLDQIVTYGKDIIFAGENAEPSLPSYSGESPSLPNAEDRKAPDGYDSFGGDVQTFTTVLPGHSLLFSVPINHIDGPGWYMRVRFSLDLPNSKRGPYSYADSFTVHLPPQYLQGGRGAKH